MVPWRRHRPLPHRRGPTALGLALTVLWLSGLAAAGTPRPAGQRTADPLLRSPDLLLALNIPDLRGTATRVDRFLATITGGALGTPGQTLRQIGDLLRNPGLDNIAEGAFLELLSFVPQRQGTPWVLAFPVNEPQTYVRLLSSQAGISSQASGPGLIHFREQRAGITDFYLATVRKQLVVFGYDRAVVRRAAALYAPGARPLLQARQGDMAFLVSLERLRDSTRGQVDRAVQQLQSDLTRDLTQPDAPERESVERLVRQALARLRELYAQLQRLQGHLVLEHPLVLREAPARDTRALYLRLALHCSAGDLATFLGSATPRTPELLGYLPAGTLSFDWSAPGENQLRALTMGLTERLLDGLREPLSGPAQQELNEWLAQATALPIIESAAATVRYRQPENAPGQLHRLLLLRLARPIDLPAWLDTVARATAAPGALRRELRQNGIALTLTRTPLTLAPQQAPAQQVDFTLQGRLNEESGAAGLEWTATFLLARQGDLLLGATGPQAAAILGALHRATARRNQRWVRAPLGRNTLEMLGGQTGIHISMVVPSAYIRTARDRGLLALDGRPAPRASGPADGSALPALLRLTRSPRRLDEGGEVDVHALLPYATLTELLEAAMMTEEATQPAIR